MYSTYNLGHVANNNVLQLHKPQALSTSLAPSLLRSHSTLCHLPTSLTYQSQQSGKKKHPNSIVTYSWLRLVMRSTVCSCSNHWTNLATEFLTEQDVPCCQVPVDKPSPWEVPHTLSNLLAEGQQLLWQTFISNGARAGWGSKVWYCEPQLSVTYCTCSLERWHILLAITQQYQITTDCRMLWPRRPSSAEYVYGTDEGQCGQIVLQSVVIWYCYVIAHNQFTYTNLYLLPNSLQYSIGFCTTSITFLKGMQYSVCLLFCRQWMPPAPSARLYNLKPHIADIAHSVEVDSYVHMCSAHWRVEWNASSEEEMNSERDLHGRTH